MKRIMIILLFCLVILSSCSNNCSDKPSFETKQGETVLDTTVDETTCIDNDTCNVNELSDEMAITIAKNCFLTISSAEFDETECVPYSEIFRYYTYDACFSPDRKGIAFEVVYYYDAQKMTFSVPYRIVDSFLEKVFNTKADRYSIDCFNSDTECYEFDQHLGECFYDIILIDKEKISDNKYSFVVQIKHMLTDQIPYKYNKYVIEMIDDDYKILSRIVEVAE